MTKGRGMDEQEYHGRTETVYHSDPDCPRGRQIPPEWKVRGSGGRSLCSICRAREAARSPRRPDRVSDADQPS